MMEPRAFLIPDGLTLRQVESRAIGRFRVTAPPAGRAAGRAVVRYLDTFDWRVYRSGRALEVEGPDARLIDLGSGRVQHRCRVARPPRVWGDFPDGPFRDSMRALLDCRALMPRFSVSRVVREARILDDVDKTVARLRLDDVEVEKRHRRTAIVVPVLGYDAHADALVAWLREIGCEPAPTSAFEAAASAAGSVPGDYSPKLDLPLERAMPSRVAAAIAFRHLLDVVLRNEPGIRDDIDTEFLHDFRVAIRRTRSALVQFKDVLPAARVDHFKGAWRDTARVTSRLRDLDVYLLDQDRLRSMLPENLRAGLDPYFAGLDVQRAECHARVVAMLDSHEYRTLVDAWRREVDSLEKSGAGGKGGGVAVEVLAERLIRRRLRRVLRGGSPLGAGDPPRAFHALRILCKKLRYALETFAPLYADDIARPLVRHLKRLQDNLGEFNDLTVQERDLHERLERARMSAAEAAAVGGLIAVLDRRAHEVRGEFAACFAEFAAPSIEDDFERMFAAPRGPS